MTIDKTAAILQELQEQLLDEESIIESYGRTQGLSPEEVLIQKEKLQAVITLYHKIAEVLTPEEFDAFIRWVVEGRSYTEIGSLKHRHTGVKLILSKKSKENQSKRKNKDGKSIIRTILRKLGIIGDTDECIICKQLILDNPSMEEMSTPSFHIGWLSSRLMKINNGAYWTQPKKQDKKKPEYKSRTVCLIPEYMQESFGDSLTKCMICGIKCTRKKDN